MLKQSRNRAGEKILSEKHTIEITQAQKCTLIWALMRSGDIEESALSELLEILGVKVHSQAARTANH